MSFIMAGAAIVGAGVGIGKAISSGKRKREAEREQAKAQARMDKQKAAFEQLDTSNPFANMKNQFEGQTNQMAGLENTMEDLTINQKGMELQNQQGQQQRANIMGQLKGSAGGSGVAALAQQMAQSGQLASQQSAATIGDQEAANQKAMAGEAGRLQTAETSEASRLQTQEAQGATDIQSKKGEGEIYSRDAERNKVSTLLGMEQGAVAGQQERADAANAAKWDGLTSMAGSLTSLASDRRLKKNIELIGSSPSGISIYTFEYTDDTLGEGRFQGAMSDEVPSDAVVKHEDGYDMVDYSKIDVEFKNID